MTPNIGVLIVGIIFAGVGGLMVFNYIKAKKACTMSTPGEVIAYNSRVSHSRGHSTLVYHPVFRYYVNGQWYEKEYGLGKNTFDYQIGQTVEILYDPNNPDTYLVAGEKQDPAFSFICLIIGIGVIVLSFFAD